MSKTNHALTAVGLYILAVWILYGRKEVLPKPILTSFKVDLSQAKRDPKVEQFYAKAITAKMSEKGVSTMYALNEVMKKEKKVSA